MRVRVLPRETAAAVITSAVAAMGWAVAIAVILSTVPVLTETLALRDRLHDLPATLILLGVVLGGVVAVALRPRRWVVLLFLAVGGLATVGYEVILLTGDPGIVASSPYLVNRPALALVLVGIPASRARVPNFDELEAETRALAHGEDLARRTTAVVHDTLLNDLAVVMNSPDGLDDRTRERLLADLDTLRGADWITASPDTEIPTEADAVLRNDLARLASEFQWRGVSMQITGSVTGRYLLSAEVSEALLAATRACLENVVRHSGAASTEVELIADAEHVTVMVTDQGRGFDPSAVGSDRLGLRTSVVERMAAVGGSAKIWSAPGQGTSVIISAPILEAAES